MKFSKKEICTKSNLLSMLRLFLAIPIFFLIGQINLSLTIRIISLCLLLFASVTDILDGYLARRYNEITEFGKIIDPLADKVVIGITILQLFLIGEIPGYYLIIIIGRDLLILIGGVFVSEKIGQVLPSNKIGKITALSIGLFILAIVGNLKLSFSPVYYFLFYLSMFLVFISFIVYLIRGIKVIIRNN
jgi:CDP-diacylglycerol--glycerol-3-phosphate 3-phosphatidyltransferase